MIYVYTCTHCGDSFKEASSLKGVEKFDYEKVQRDSRAYYHQSHWVPTKEMWCNNCVAGVDGGRYASKA